MSIVALSDEVRGKAKHALMVHRLKADILDVYLSGQEDIFESFEFLDDQLRLFSLPERLTMVAHHSFESTKLDRDLRAEVILEIFS